MQLCYDHATSSTTSSYLLSLKFDDSDVSRMNELSELARLGALATTDAAELDSYIHGSNLLAVIQSKARQTLNAPEEYAE